VSRPNRAEATGKINSVTPNAGLSIIRVFNLTGTFPSFLIVKVTKTVVPPPGAKAPPLIFKLTLVAPPAKIPVT
jgi:hypothetical protein